MENARCSALRRTGAEGTRQASCPASIADVSMSLWNHESSSAKAGSQGGLRGSPGGRQRLWLQHWGMQRQEEPGLQPSRRHGKDDLSSLRHDIPHVRNLPEGPGRRRWSADDWGGLPLGPGMGLEIAGKP